MTSQYPPSEPSLGRTFDDPTVNLRFTDFDLAQSKPDIGSFYCSVYCGNGYESRTSSDLDIVHEFVDDAGSSLDAYPKQDSAQCTAFCPRLTASVDSLILDRSADVAKMASFLTKIFTNSFVLNDLSSISAEDAEVIFVILARKFFKSRKTEIGGDAKKNLWDLIGLLSRRKRKRNEENLRFILKKVFGELKDSLATCPELSQSINIYELFFRTYFQPFATDKLDFACFRSTKDLQASHRIKEMMTAFHSPAIRKAFFDLATRPSISESKLLADYAKKTEKKFHKLLSKWSSNGKISLKHQKDAMHRYFSNNQCKFPWTTDEISEAVSWMVSSISKLSVHTN